MTEPVRSGGYTVWRIWKGKQSGPLPVEPGDFVMWSHSLRWRVAEDGTWRKLEPYSDDWTTVGAVVEQAAAPAWKPGDDVKRGDAQMREWYEQERQEGRA